MVGISSILDDRRNRFANNFERANDGYVYHPDPEGPGVHVSVAEHDTFIRRYDWSLSCSLVSVLLGIFMVVGFVIEVLPDPGWPPLPALAICLGLIVVFATFETYDQWSRRAPARALKARLG